MLSTGEAKALLKAVAEGVREHVRAAVTDLRASVTDIAKRLEAVEARLAVAPKYGEKGDPGRDAQIDPEMLERLVAAAVEKAVAALPPAQGVTVEDMQPTVEAAVKAAVEALPPAKDGAPGNDADPEQMRQAVAQEVARAVAALPKPADGKSVTLDDVKSLLEGMQAQWALDFERRAQDILQRAIDRIPLPRNGKDGRDGFSLEDFDLTHDGEGNLTLRFARGEFVKEFVIRLPVFIDRGIFKADTAYRCGNAVTFGNSLWIAQKDDPEGKPGLSPDWRLSVRAGRDGRPGKDGEKGEKGDPGKDGRDLTAFGHIPN